MEVLLVIRQVYFMTDYITFISVMLVIVLSYSVCGIVGGLVIHRFVFGYWFWKNV